MASTQAAAWRSAWRPSASREENGFAERLLRTIREEEIDLSGTATSPTPTAGSVCSSTTCITGSGSIRRWAT